MENWGRFLQEQKSYSLSQGFRKLEKDIAANPLALALRKAHRAGNDKEVERIQKELVDQVQAELLKFLAPLMRVSKIRAHLDTYLREEILNPAAARDYISDLIVPARRDPVHGSPFVPWSREQNLNEFLDIGSEALGSLANTRVAGIPLGKVFAKFLPDNWDKSILNAIRMLSEYVYDNILGGKDAKPMQEELLVMIVRSLVQHTRRFVLGAAFVTFKQKKAAAAKFMFFGGHRLKPLNEIIKYIMKHRNKAITPAIIKGMVQRLRWASRNLKDQNLEEVQMAFKDIADLFEAIAELKIK